MIINYKMDTIRAKEKNNQEEGDIFYVYNDYHKKYFFGKVLVDMLLRIFKKEELVHFLNFYRDCYLVGVYTGLYDAPVLENEEFLIPGVYIKKSYFKVKGGNKVWQYYAHEDVDYHLLDFPEYLMMSDNRYTFVKGEVGIPVALTQQQYDNEFNIRGVIQGNMPFVEAIKLQGREDMIDFENSINIENHDLRFNATKRKYIYGLIGEDPGISYYDLSFKNGKDIGRFYKEK